MLFYFDSSGNLLKSVPGNVYQGSNKASIVYVTIPLPTNVTATANIKLPNGVYLKPRLVSNGAIPNTSIDGELNFALWSLELEEPMTAYAGDMEIQFAFYPPNMDKITTANIIIPILRGNPTVLPEEPTEDIYEQILALLSQTQGDIYDINGEKQDKLIPGDNITIEDNVISATQYNTSITDKYFERTTANGEKILNNSFAKIAKITGQTREFTNLFNIEESIDGIEKLSPSSFKYTVKNPAIFNVSLSKGNYTFCTKSLISAFLTTVIVTLKANDIVVLSKALDNKKEWSTLYISALEDNTNYILEVQIVGKGAIIGSTDNIAIMLLSGEYATIDLPRFLDYGETVLLSSYFKKLISKSADGTQESVVEFAEPIEVGKGVTIDFDKGKIITETLFSETTRSINISGKYIAYNDGTETIESGVENSLPCTLEQYYVGTEDIEVNPTNEATEELIKLKLGKTTYFIPRFVRTEDIIDNLMSEDKTKPLSAKQGKVLKEKIEQAIAGIDKLTRKIVNELPETGENNIIYLVPNAQSTDKNIKDEYMWIDNQWELIGNTSIDLTDYQPKKDDRLETESKEIVGAINELHNKTPEIKIEVDKTLNEEGKAADSKAVGDAIRQVRGEIVEGVTIDNTVLVGQDENGGNIYEQIFSNDYKATFTAPKGEQGIQGPQGIQGEQGNGITNIEYVVDLENGDRRYKIILENGREHLVDIPKGKDGVSININGIVRENASELPDFETVNVNDGYLVKDSNSYSGHSLYFKGADSDDWTIIQHFGEGEQGPKGDTGAKIVSTELVGQDENGGNIYRQTFDNNTTSEFTAPIQPAILSPIYRHIFSLRKVIDGVTTYLATVTIDISKSDEFTFETLYEYLVSINAIGSWRYPILGYNDTLLNASLKAIKDGSAVGDLEIKGYNIDGSETSYYLFSTNTEDVDNAIKYISLTRIGGQEGIPIDNTLTVQGAPADAKAVGDAIEELKGNQGGSSLDVQIDGTSIVEEVEEDGVVRKVAKIPIANVTDKLGLLKVSYVGGTAVTADGRIYIIKATEDAIKQKGTQNLIIAPQNIQYAVKAGLIPKERYTTEEYNALLTTDNTWTAEEQAAARETLGISGGGTQLYKHEMIIDKTENESGFTYKKLEFVSTQSTAFTSVDDALQDIYNNPFTSLAKGYSVEEVTNDYIGYIETYIDFVVVGKSNLKCSVATVDGVRNNEDVINCLSPFGTIEEYTPTPLQGE